MHKIPVENIAEAIRRCRTVRRRCPNDFEVDWREVVDRDVFIEEGIKRSHAVIRTSNSEVLVFHSHSTVLLEFEFADPADRRLLEPPKLAPLRLKDQARHVEATIAAVGIDVGPLNIWHQIADSRVRTRVQADLVVFTPHGRLETELDGELRLAGNRFMPYRHVYGGNSVSLTEFRRLDDQDRAERRRISALLPPGCTRASALEALADRVQTLVFDHISQECLTCEQPRPTALQLSCLPCQRRIENLRQQRVSEHQYGDTSVVLFCEDKAYTVCDSWSAGLARLGLQPLEVAHGG